MKKFLALLMAAMLLLSCASALAEFDTHVEFSLTNRGILTAGVDYTADEFYQWVCDKFNVSIDVIITDKATHEATTTMWINNGDMCDILTQADFHYDTYCTWVDQGLLAPLPEGWEETYPNLKNAMEKSMILDKLTIDGKVYGIPADVFLNFVEMPIPVAHQCIYYRKDWAQKLGYEFGDTVTITELKEFSLKCKELDLAGNGATVGLTTRTRSFIPDMMNMLDVTISKFEKTENGYIWAPCAEGVTAQIAMIRDLYASGMLDADFYLLDADSCVNRFASGVAAALYMDGGPGNHYTVWTRFADAQPDLNPDECIASVVLADANGVAHTAEATNFWTVKYFSPDIAPETMDRILAIIDYFNDGAEGQVANYDGIPGVDWQWTENGLIDMSIRDPEKPTYTSTNLFSTWGTCSDELYSYNATNKYPVAIESYLHNMQVKANGAIVRYDYDYAYFQSDAKSVYSVDVNSKIAELVVDTALDIDTEWNNFIKDNEGMWKPVQDDLNAAFFAN